MIEIIGGVSSIVLCILLYIAFKIGSNHDYELLEEANARLVELKAENQTLTDENEKLKNAAADAQRIIDIMGAMIAGQGDHPHLTGNH